MSMEILLLCKLTTNRPGIDWWPRPRSNIKSTNLNNHVMLTYILHAKNEVNSRTGRGNIHNVWSASKTARGRPLQERLVRLGTSSPATFPFSSSRAAVNQIKRKIYVCIYIYAPEVSLLYEVEMKGLPELVFYLIKSTAQHVMSCAEIGVLRVSWVMMQQWPLLWRLHHNITHKTDCPTDICHNCLFGGRRKYAPTVQITNRH